MEIKKNRIAREYILAFFVPVIIMTAALAAAGLYPFGGLCIFNSDLKDQYVHVIAETANKIKNGESVLYSYRAGLGVDWYTQFWGYIDPVNLLFLAAPAKHFQSAYIAAYVIKLGLCGLAASLFLYNCVLTRTKGIWNVALSALYALCMFNITNSINFFFLNPVILFPLCLLAAAYMSDKKDGVPFAVVYALSVFSSCYMAYMTGIATFVFYIYYGAATGKKARDMLLGTLKMVACAAAAIALSAVVILPWVSTVRNNYTQVFSEVKEGYINYSIIDICRSYLFINDGMPVLTEYPSVFFGIAPLFLTACLVFSPSVSKKERAAVLCTVVFFFLVMFLRPLYKAMHVFRAPTGFPCRYIYTAVFIHLVFAARMLKLWQDDEAAYGKKPRFVPLMLVILALALVLGKQINLYYILFALVDLALAAAYTFMSGTPRGRAAMAVIAAAETVICTAAGVYIIKKYVGYDDYALYNRQITNATKAADVMKAGDSGFYRAANIDRQCSLSQLSEGYNSFSTFLSTANQKSSKFEKAMGLHAVSDGRTVNNADNDIFTESIFGVKYVFASDTANTAEDINKNKIYLPDGARLVSDMYKSIYKDDDTEIFENTLAFPLMFAADKGVDDCISGFYGGPGDVYHDREAFLNSLYGTDYRLYTQKDMGEPSFLNCHTVQDGDTEHIMLDNLPEGMVSAIDAEQVGVMEYITQADEDGEYSLDLYFKNMPVSQAFLSYVVMVNGAYIEFDYQKNDTIRSLGHLKKGDIIHIRILTRYNDTVFMQPKLMLLDTSALSQISKKANENGLKNVYERGGIIDAVSEFDKDSFVFTTLAYEDGTRVYVDGAPVETIQTAQTFLGGGVGGGACLLHKKENFPLQTR